ncbi:hypothetical protein GCM10007173_23780 [Glutamicibacter ardleyensis]|uniref:Uncharacterized protein n=1 Tax=Glutamicibacter ardleyensis TaxID=225894 RepID=A0ABQ2DMD0_9MICC|nr:hypothetical protein GCM10007173_23780 [Glutamicibacter ardleyensis]
MLASNNAGWTAVGIGLGGEDPDRVRGWCAEVDVLFVSTQSNGGQIRIRVTATAAESCLASGRCA